MYVNAGANGELRYVLILTREVVAKPNGSCTTHDLRSVLDEKKRTISGGEIDVCIVENHSPADWHQATIHGFNVTIQGHVLDDASNDGDVRVSENEKDARLTVDHGIFDALAIAEVSVGREIDYGLGACNGKLRARLRTDWRNGDAGCACNVAIDW